MGRRDATRIVWPDGYHNILPYVMPKKTEAEVSLHETLDITELMKFIEEKNKEGHELKMFHCFCTAIGKMLYHRPKMNSFIAGRRFWQRKEITLSFVAKKKFADDGDEGLMTLHVKPDMTVYDVSKYILGDVEKVRETGKNDLDGLMDAFGKMPRWFLTFFFFILSRLEYHGIMPKGLTDGDPNYTSVLLSNLGSIKCGAPYHHLSNYGTNSVMITIGTIHKEKVLQADGSEEIRDMLDICATLDERIADGFYFSKSLKYASHLLSHPEELEKTIEEVTEYEF